MTKNKKQRDLIEKVLATPTHPDKASKPEIAKPKPQGKPAPKLSTHIPLIFQAVCILLGLGSIMLVALRVLFQN